VIADPVLFSVKEKIPAEPGSFLKAYKVELLLLCFLSFLSWLLFSSFLFGCFLCHGFWFLKNLFADEVSNNQRIKKIINIILFNTALLIRTDLLSAPKKFTRDHAFEADLFFRKIFSRV
jgi:hypothetical protein